jgi:Ca-activated chloride channel homolog
LRYIALRYIALRYIALRYIVAVSLAGALALVMVAPLSAGQTPVFRTGVDLVNLAITVTDRKGNLVSDLKASDFDIYEDGKKQAISYFSIGTIVAGGPELHIGVVMDISSSMGQYLAFTKSAAIKFLNSLSTAVDITVIDFDSEIRLARYGPREFPRVVERIRGQKAAGATALYDAIGVYLDSASEQEGRKIMLLYTDGADTVSSLSFQGLRDLLKASDVTVYSVGVMPSNPTSISMGYMGIMHQIADITGGEAYFPTSINQLDDAYAKILKQIHAQYAFGYVSTNTKTDGAWRKVEIKVVAKDRRDYRVRARDGYYGQYKPTSKP